MSCISYKPLTVILVALLATAASVANAQQVACDGKSLSPDQRWNPPNRAVTPALSRFYSLQESLSREVAQGQDAVAEAVALEYLEVAKQFPCNWNYGNAIHDANTVLGLRALKLGRRDEAVRYLREAGKSPGSPQLDSFGPAVVLANALAQAGALGDVAAYLRDVRRFWKMDYGAVEKWLAELEAGRVPNFGIQLRRPI